MKRIPLCFFAALLFLAGCEKNSYTITDRQGIEGKSMVKIGLFNMTPAATSVLIFNNGERISGPLASPYPYPGGGFNTGGNSNGDYFAATPGVNKFEFYLTNPGTPNVTTKIFETTQTLEVDKRQTIYIADTAANMVAVFAPDDAVAPDSGFARIRFINLIPNSTGLDFYKGTTLLKSNIKYKEFTPFFDVQASLADSFVVRLPGAAATTAAYRLATNTNQRIYSFVARGYLGVPTTDTRRRPEVSVSVNQ